MGRDKGWNFRGLGFRWEKKGFRSMATLSCVYEYNPDKGSFYIAGACGEGQGKGSGRTGVAVGGWEVWMRGGFRVQRARGERGMCPEGKGNEGGKQRTWAGV